MLPQKNRLIKKKDFDLVFKEGENIKNNFLVFKVLKNNLKESRFGFVVSKKVSNKATVRNKVKRRLRKAILNKLKTLSQLAPQGKIEKSVDVIIIALSGTEEKEFLRIQEAIDNSFKKIKFI